MLPGPQNFNSLDWNLNEFFLSLHQNKWYYHIYDGVLSIVHERIANPCTGSAWWARSSSAVRPPKLIILIVPSVDEKSNKSWRTFSADCPHSWQLKESWCAVLGKLRVGVCVCVRQGLFITSGHCNDFHVALILYILALIYNLTNLSRTQKHSYSYFCLCRDFLRHNTTLRSPTYPILKHKTTPTPTFKSHLNPPSVFWSCEDQPKRPCSTSRSLLC